ncbi:MAG: hypothetical protein WC640_00045 [Candidatus Paceibacterota bacterium]|jgi:hypothetical protein
MKGVIWLASGLMLSLLLVSGISVGSQLAESGNFFATQDLKVIGQSSSRALGKINQGLNSQLSPLKNSAAVVTTGNIFSAWLPSLTNWLGNLWQRAVSAWKNFLGLTSQESQITPAMREQIRQELLAELKNQGLFNSNLSTNTDALGTRYGIMVAPSTGSTTRDELLKKSLSQMFADQVSLRFDQTGMSGVVTPTFRDGRKGGDYIFVLTPLP